MGACHNALRRRDEECAGGDGIATVLERIQSALDDKSAIKKLRSQILDEIQQHPASAFHYFAPKDSSILNKSAEGFASFLDSRHLNSLLTRSLALETGQRWLGKIMTKRLKDHLNPQVLAGLCYQTSLSQDDFDVHVVALGKCFANAMCCKTNAIKRAKQYKEVQDKIDEKYAVH